MNVRFAAILFIVSCRAQASGEGWERHFAAAEAFTSSGDYAGALREFELALPEAESFGRNAPALAVTLTNAGVIDVRLGRYREAEARYRRAISIYREHPELATGLATTLQDFAVLKVAERQWSGARDLYRQAYELFLGALGPDDAHVAKNLNARGELAAELRNYEEALKLYGQALEISLRSGAPAIETAGMNQNLAALYRETGRPEQAADLFASAIATYERVAPRHPNFAIVLRNYADMKTDLREFPAAEAAYRQALEICDAALPKDSPETGAILQAYGRFLVKVRRGAEAKRVAERSRGILEQTFRATDGRNLVDWRDLAVNPK